MILIGAHYDSTGERKDPRAPPTAGAGVAALLAVAEALKETLPYGALRLLRRRENGLNGSRAYAASLDTDAVAKLLAMVNYGTIAGVTSSMSTRPTPTWPGTAAPTEAAAASDPKVRDRLLAISQQTATPFAIHPSYSGCRKGPAAGPIMPFACLGCPSLRGGHQLHHQQGRWL